MTVSVRIDADLAVVFVRATGDLRTRDVLAHRRSLLDHPAYRRGMNHVVDLRHATLAPGPAEMRLLISDDPFDDGGRRALVVERDLMFGLGRVYEMLADQRQISFRPFRTLGEACAWLGIPEERAREALESLEKDDPAP